MEPTNIRPCSVVCKGFGGSNAVVDSLSAASPGVSNRVLHRGHRLVAGNCV